MVSIEDVLAGASSPVSSQLRTPFFNGGGYIGIPMYTLIAAAAAVGRNKTAILRAIEAGKIPVSHTEAGDILIEPADLHRVYPPFRTKDTPPSRMYQSHPLLTALG